MSIHYGVSRYTYKTEKIRAINYKVIYKGLRNPHNTYPKESSPDGYPINTRLYCKGYHPDAGFKILTHRFDADDVLKAPLTLRYKIRLALSDGTVQLIDLEDVNYFGPGVERCESSFFIEKSYKFSEINKKKAGDRDIYAFDIVFAQISGDGRYDNESVMDIVVDY